MTDHFSDCTHMMEDVVRKHIHDEQIVDRLMFDLVQVVGNYAVAEIKELNLRTNEMLTEALRGKKQ
jgi:hypothetical protein